MAAILCNLILGVTSIAQLSKSAKVVISTFQRCARSSNICNVCNSGASAIFQFGKALGPFPRDVFYQIDFFVETNFHQHKVRLAVMYFETRVRYRYLNLFSL